MMFLVQMIQGLPAAKLLLLRRARFGLRDMAHLRRSVPSGAERALYARNTHGGGRHPGGGPRSPTIRRGNLVRAAGRSAGTAHACRSWDYGTPSGRAAQRRSPEKGEKKGTTRTSLFTSGLAGSTTRCRRPRRSAWPRFPHIAYARRPRSAGVVFVHDLPPDARLALTPGSARGNRLGGIGCLSQQDVFPGSNAPGCCPY